MSRLSLTDIGLTPSVAPVEQTPAKQSVATGISGVPLIPGSVLAQVVYQMWRGTECVIVKSPPGGGKSSLVAQVAHILKTQLDEPVTVITPTNDAGASIAARIVDAFGYGTAAAASSNIQQLREGVVTPKQADDEGLDPVEVRTIASAAQVNPAGIVIVDEAYQASYSEIADAVDGAAQVLMVGDPGQIGPVVAVDTSLFAGREIAPHVSAPTIFELNPDAFVISMDQTYRLGQDTVDVVEALYDFPFASKRLPHAVDGHAEIETLAVPDAKAAHDSAMLSVVVDRVCEMIGKTHRFIDHTTGREVVEAVKPWHIAVVVAHNTQSSHIRGRLDQLDGSKYGHTSMVEVGTADRIQGGQWPVVVSLDPLAGVQTVVDHHISLGRLCVMLSRHTSHLTFVHEENWRTRLASVERMARHEIAVNREVRRSLGI